MRRTLAFAATVVTALTASLLGSATAASAATAPCPSNFYCFYDNSGYTGWHLNYNTTTTGSFNQPPGSSGDRRNQLSSIINNGNRTVCVWDDVTLRADKLLVRVAPYQDYTYVGPSANDKADYWKVYAGSSGC